MKLKKLSNLKSRLIKLELIKLKILQKYSNNYLLKKKIDQLGISFKKALTIIHQYHKKKQKILFVGITQKIQNQYRSKLKRTKHSFLSEFDTNNGLLVNTITTFKSLKVKESSTAYNENKIRSARSYFLLKNSFSLIVVINSKSQLSIIKEAIKLKIPLVALTTSTIIDDKSFYRIPGEFNNFEKLQKKLFSLLLNPILRKVKIKNVQNKK